LNNIFIKLVIVLAVGAAIAYYGLPYFQNSLLKRDIKSIVENKTKIKSATFNSNDFSKLPYIVKKYLRRSIKKSSSLPSNCKIKATGKMRKSIKDEWVEASAENYYSTITPEFLTIIETKTHTSLWTETIDKYINNKATTTNKFLSIIPTYKFEGNKLNKSYLVLYLLESVFCPTVLLPNMNIHWKKIDNNKAKATIWDNHMRGSAIFHFNKNGDVTKVVTEDRYMPGELDYNRETFTLSLANYKDVGDYYIPTYFEYEWNLAANNFTFGRFQILDISYNIPSLK
jgi:hypothetical protein